jgi:hypothetical protein
MMLPFINNILLIVLGFFLLILLFKVAEGFVKFIIYLIIALILIKIFFGFPPL